MGDNEEVIDLDPHRTVTYLDNGVPHCYMGHAECYDNHTSERLADEADFASDLDRDWYWAFMHGSNRNSLA